MDRKKREVSLLEFSFGSQMDRNNEPSIFFCTCGRVAPQLEARILEEREIRRRRRVRREGGRRALRLGFGVEGLGFGFEGLGLGLRVWGLGLRVWGLGFRFRV